MKPEEPDEPFEIELLPPSATSPPAPSDPRSVSGRPTIPQPPVVIETPLVTEDEQIYCPVCNYNLSGIFSGRCPECGSLFSRDALIAAQQANQITLIPWDDPEPMSFRRRLIETLRVCLLSAERFAFAFSVQPQQTNAAAFFAWVTLATTVLTVLSVLAFAAGTHLSHDPFSGLASTTAGVLAVALFVPVFLIVSTLLSSLFLGSSCTHYDGKHHLKPWLSISAYASAHYLLTFPAIPILFLVGFGIARSGGAEFVFVGLVIWMGCAALCVLTLRPVVDFRTTEANAVRVAVLFLSMIHAGTLIAAAWLSILAGNAMVKLF